MENLNDQLMARMREMTPPGVRLELPPKVFVDMGGELLDYQADQALTVRFPVQERYQNPMGAMQGGAIAAAIDNTLGPLSYLAAPPSVTTQLNVSYLRPITPGDQHIVVEGRVVERTRNQLFLTATVYNQAGKVAAIGHATCLIVASPATHSP